MTPARFAHDPAPAEVYGPADLTPADLKARRAALVAAFALAPVTPRHDVTLTPSRPALARLGAIRAGAF